MKIQVDPQDKAATASTSVRNVTLKLLVSEKNLRFIWYGGDASVLKYANVVHPVLPKDMAEWKRRGAAPFALIGTTATDTIEKLCNKAVENGCEGACFDEVGKTNKDFPALLKLFPKIKEAHPGFFLACWQIGEYSDESIVSIKAGEFDLFIVEVYLELGRTPLAVLEKVIRDLQKYGISDRSMIGLGLEERLFRGKTPDEQIEFLTEQMKLIRRIAPEMPGVAFFSFESGDPKVVKRVDELCAELFFNQPKK